MTAAAAERYPYPPDDPAGMTALAAKVDAVSVAVADLGTGLGSDAGGLAAAWAGVASDACQAEVAALVKLLGAWSQGIAGGTAALTTWAKALQSAQDDVDGIRSSYDSGTSPATLDGQYEDAMATVAQAGRTARAALESTVDGIAPGAPGTAAGVLSALPVLASAKPDLATPPATTTAELPPEDASPEEVNAWWSKLTPEQQDQLVRQYPDVIGKLDGIPAKDRSLANEILLDSDLTTYSAKVRGGQALSADEQAVLTNASSVQEQLDTVQGKKDPVTGDPLTAQLYIYEPGAFGGDGRAAIVVGDADTADNIAVTVPGLSSDVGSYMDNQTKAALSLYDESRKSAPGSSTAVVAWVGYDAPSGAGSDQVASSDAALAGGKLLASDVTGLLAARPGDDPHLTVIGHSYGSTTVGYAASIYGLPADDVVLIGSPGDTVDDVNADYTAVPDGHVWTGANSKDPVASADYYGDDPAEQGSGATRFNAEDDKGGGHSNYYDPGSESLQNMSDIVTGQYDSVETTQQRPDVAGPNNDYSSDELGPNGKILVDQPASQPILDPDADGDGIADDHEEEWAAYFEGLGVVPPIPVR